MKKIEAIIQRHSLDKVRDALVAVGVQGMTASEAHEYGEHNGQTSSYRGAEYIQEFIPCIKIEIALDEEILEEAIEAIMTAANAEQVCLGKIFVSDLETVIRIRTGEYNYNAV